MNEMLQFPGMANRHP